MEQISPLSLQQWLMDDNRTQPVLLDVREPWEYERCHIQGSTLVPMNEIPNRYTEVDAEAEVVVICHHGVRSYHVARFLDHNGFSKVYNLQGGVDAWAQQVDPAMQKY
jgi:rhodanese-related sulfurtransferase